MLNILSLDMIIEICKYCDYQSIYNLEYSCKEIYQLINYNTEFWKNIIINKKSIYFYKNLEKYFILNTIYDYKKSFYNIKKFELICKNNKYQIWTDDEYIYHWKLLVKISNKKNNNYLCDHIHPLLKL